MTIAQKYLKKIPQYTRNARHLRSVLQHGTPRKWSNLALVEYERLTRKVHVKSRPYILFLDPCNYCDLRCPLCPTGMNALGRPQKMLSFECFKTYFDPLAPYLFECILHNWGESLLNKEIYQMISYAQSKNVGTNLSSNFVNTKDEDIDKLLDSGLEYLIVSLDGTNQESYARYRVRGDFEKVRRNLSTFLERRVKRRQKTPVVEWQYIVMKHNEQEVEQAEHLSRELGVDVMRFIPVGLPFEAENKTALAKDWFPTTVAGRVEINDGQQIFGQDGRRGGCYYLYRSMTINPDGGVSPCCIVYKKERDFANLDGMKVVDVDALWNNDKFRSGRSLFSSVDVLDRPSTICDKCTLFAWHPRKALQATRSARHLPPSSSGGEAAYGVEPCRSPSRAGPGTSDAARRRPRTHPPLDRRDAQPGDGERGGTVSMIRFVCPKCRSDVQLVDGSTCCTGCQARYNRIRDAFPDFAPATSFDDHWTLDPERKRRWLEFEAPREEEYEIGLARRYVRPLLGRLGVRPGSAVLSAGCGLGADVDLLVNEGFDSWGIDIGSRVIRWGDRAHPERFARGDIRFMPFPDQSFDFVLSLNTIEHIGTVGDTDQVTPDYLEQRRSAIDDLLRVTRPGGYLLLSGLSRTVPLDFGHVQNHGFVRIHSPWEKFLLNYSDIKRLCEETGLVDWTRPQPLRGFFAWTRLRKHPISRPLLPLVDWLFGSLPESVYGWGICPFYIALARRKG